MNEKEKHFQNLVDKWLCYDIDLFINTILTEENLTLTNRREAKFLQIELRKVMG